MLHTLGWIQPEGVHLQKGSFAATVNRPQPEKRLLERVLSQDRGLDHNLDEFSQAYSVKEEAPGRHERMEQPFRSGADEDPLVRLDQFAPSGRRSRPRRWGATCRDSPDSSPSRDCST